MEKGTLAVFKEEGHFFDPYFSLYETRKIAKGQKVKIITKPDVEGQITVTFFDGEFQGQELRTTIYDLSEINE